MRLWPLSHDSSSGRLPKASGSALDGQKTPRSVPALSYPELREEGDLPVLKSLKDSSVGEESSCDRSKTGVGSLLSIFILSSL